MDGHLPAHCHYKSNHFVPNKGISDSLLAFDFVLNGSLFDSNRVKRLEGHLGGQVVDGGHRKKPQASQFLNQWASDFHALENHRGGRSVKNTGFQAS